MLEWNLCLKMVLHLSSHGRRILYSVRNSVAGLRVRSARYSVIGSKSFENAHSMWLTNELKQLRIEALSVKLRVNLRRIL